MADGARVADNGDMRIASPPWSSLSCRRSGFGTVVVSLLFLAGCPVAEFQPDDVDGGFRDEGVTAADIGVPCVYDPANPQNPTNQCPTGTECVIVTRDGRFNTLGMSLPFWEDQLTVATTVGGVDVDIGYCSVVGSAAAPPVCPTGTLTKFFTSPGAAGGFAGMCLLPCSASAECGGDRVCDVRFVDDGLQATGFCVSPCRADLSHCVRSAIVPLDGNGAFATGLFINDVAGDSVCDLDTGLCGNATSKDPLGTDGAPCGTSLDCGPALACYQPQIFFDPPEVGFCAKRCTVQQQEGGRPEQGSCDPGEACQPGLAFGYDPNAVFNGMLVFDPNGVGTREGICLDLCVETFDECGDGTSCGFVEASVVGQQAVAQAVCVPPILDEGR